MTEMIGKTLPASIRTGEGLRNLLFDEIDALREGTGDRRRAITICSLASQIISAAKLEIEYEQQQSLKGTAERATIADHKPSTLRLGSGRR
jgi:hypothetical protein